MSVHAGEVQRRVAVVVLSVCVGLVVQQQQLDDTTPDDCDCYSFLTTVKLKDERRMFLGAGPQITLQKQLYRQLVVKLDQ